MDRSSAEILTIGHSMLTYEQFLALVSRAGVTAIADVRSSPYSRNFPQFNKETLKIKLKEDGIAYSFLGEELGGRPKDRALYRNGIADYEQMAKTPEFADGIKRVVEGSRRFRIALMCSESNPLDCHRCLLVGRALKRRGIGVGHVLQDGSIKLQSDIEADLLRLACDDLDQSDLFAPPEDRLANAYRARARRVAYSTSNSVSTTNSAAE